MNKPKQGLESNETFDSEDVGRVSFFVAGVPAPQGSKTRTQSGFFREANKRTKPWRKDVADTAFVMMAGRPKLEGPVAIAARFVFPRPAYHFGTGRNAGRLKAGAPVWREIAPDGDKLARAIGDALTGLVYRDDGQVAQWLILKSYANLGDEPGVFVDAHELGKAAA